MSNGGIQGHLSYSFLAPTPALLPWDRLRLPCAPGPWLPGKQRDAWTLFWGLGSHKIVALTVHLSPYSQHKWPPPRGHSPRPAPPLLDCLLPEHRLLRGVGGGAAIP